MNDHNGFDDDKLKHSRNMFFGVVAFLMLMVLAAVFTIK